MQRALAVAQPPPPPEINKSFHRGVVVFMRCTGVTFFLALQWQHTVHRYLRVLHRRIMKRPPKKVTMEDARKAHHIRWPLLSQGTSGEYGMMTFILEMWMDGSELNLSLFDILGHWSPRKKKKTTPKNQLKLDSGASGISGQRPLMPQRLSHVKSSAFRCPASSSGFTKRRRQS